MLKRLMVSLIVFAVAIHGVVNILADGHLDPAVMVNDQVSTDGTVTIAQVNSPAEGFIVIHADNGEGAPGPVAGFAQVYQGANYNVVVDIDTTIATSTLFAMLHEDTGEVGVYEFGTVEGADGPVSDENGVITPSFTAEIVAASDQFLDMSMITIDSVTMSQDGFVVVHAGDAEGFGAVLGFTAVPAGTSTDVVVTLEGDITDIIWPMLHVDTGEAGVYEFGTVEGADGPVAIDGTVATMPVWTVPNMRVPDQVVVGSDGMDMMDMTVTADSVLSDGPGWLVIHADNGEGGPGPVLGQTLLEDGLNTDVEVALEGDVTTTLFPMLHVDTGEAGVYEFGTVEGADGPVVVNDAVVVYPINAAPTIYYNGTLAGDTVMIDGVLADATGWLVIHADNGEGGPGPVLGQVQVYPGINTDLAVTLSGDITDTLFPMLHNDTGEVAVYEFGTVEGADGPVFVGGNVVVGPLTPEMAME